MGGEVSADFELFKSINLTSLVQSVRLNLSNEPNCLPVFSQHYVSDPVSETLCSVPECWMMDTIQNATSLRHNIILSIPIRINFLFHWIAHEILRDQGM